jgi:gas vesicle protein
VSQQLLVVRLSVNKLTLRKMTMVGETKQQNIRYDQNYQTVNPETSYTRSTTTNSVPRTNPTEQKYVTNSTPISGNRNKTTDKNINPALAGALMGGLIGVSLGALNGLLNGKKTSEGFNQTYKGVSSGFKNVGEGLNSTAKGLGEVVTSIGKGVTHTVVGGAQEAMEGVGEVTQQAANSVRDTAENINQAEADTANKVENTAESATSSLANKMDTTSDIVQYDQPASNLSVDELNDYNPDSTNLPNEEKSFEEKSLAEDDIMGTNY